MNRALPENFQPSVGLSSVFAADDASTHCLPDDSRLQPIDAAMEAQLRAMLQAETFDALILDAVRPKVFDRAVLAPFRFHFLREDVTARLVALQRNASTPEQRAEFAAALDVLRTRGIDHELGESLRYALLKG